MAKKRTTIDTSTQKKQQDMLAEALKQPGVATAIEAYGRVQQYATVAERGPISRVGYATGGNS